MWEEWENERNSLVDTQVSEGGRGEAKARAYGEDHGGPSCPPEAHALNPIVSH